MDTKQRKTVLEELRQDAITKSKRTDLPYRKRLLYRRLAQVVQLKLDRAHS